MKKFKFKNLYVVFITAFSIIILVAFCFVIHKAEYDTKILVKLGLKEPVSKTNWAVDSWNNTLEKLDFDADVVFLGDSITAGSDFREYFPNLKIVNLGYSGDTLVGMINRISGVAAVNPKKVFVLGGINGLTDANVDNSVSAYNNLMEKLIEELPNTTIYIQSVLPISSERELTGCHNSTIKEFNSRIEKLAKEKNLTYIDLYSIYECNGELNPELTKDGIHLYSESYTYWAQEISKYLE